MTSLDIIILVILGFAFFIGYQQGFIKSVISLLGWVLGAYAAILFGEQMTEYLKKIFNLGSDIMIWIGYLSVFLIVVILLNLMSSIMTKALNVMMMGTINKILGGVFNIAKYVFVLSFLNMLINASENYRFLSPKNTESSVLYEPLAAIAQAILPTVKKSWEEFDVHWKPEITPQENVPIDSLHIERKDTIRENDSLIN